MNLEIVAVLLTWASLIVAFFAAIMWLKASRIEARKGDPKSKGTIFMRSVDVQSTAREQSRWNSYAALTTAVALTTHGTSQTITHWDVLADFLEPY